MYCLISSVAGGVEVRPPLGDLGHALFSQPLLVLRGHPDVASWLSHEGLINFEGGGLKPTPIGSRKPKEQGSQVRLERLNEKRTEEKDGAR